MSSSPVTGSWVSDRAAATRSRRPGALLSHSTLDAATIVRTSLTIAAGIDIYTNTNIVVEELEC